MSEEQKESDQSSDTEIKDTDIIFDCPHCSKSLAIDYRGAGLSIPCSDCGKMVDVPIPAGLELADIEGSEEQKEILLQNLRKALSASENRIKVLEAELQEVNSRRTKLEKARSDNIYKFGTIAERSSLIQKSLDEIAAAVRKINEIAKG